MIITYRYKLKPNDLQRNQLSQAISCMRYAYNWGLELKINTYKEQKGFPKFKSKKRNEDSVKFINYVRFDFNEWKVKIPKMGWTSVCKNRTFDVSKVNLGTCCCGKNIVFIDRFEPIRKTCSQCGHKKDKLKLSDHTWKCPNCELILDRDINTAINILNIGFMEISDSESP